MGLIVLGMFVFQGCSNKLSGTINPQKAPTISWADVSSDTSFNSNPSLRWFSTDQDGLVIDYQYCVLLASTVDSLGGADGLALNFPADRQWSIVHKDSATIQLYASPDTSVYISQYVFLRAMDDDSLFSDIIFRRMSRNNHAPTCYLILPAGAQWCLPETTSSWKGTRIAWVGKDSIDIKGLQPDFSWNVRIYGPFADSIGHYSDTLDAYLYLHLVNSQTHDPWVMSKQFYFRNLQTGYYVVYATCRDDAFVSAVPALGYLRIYEPTWVRHPEETKPILIAKHNWYTSSSFTANELRVVYQDSVNEFYLNMIEDAGYGPDQYDIRNYTVGNSELAVPIADLYNHEMVILLEDDINRPLIESSGQEQESAYGKYLAVGGKVWIIGRRSFDPTSGGGRADFGLTGGHSIAYNYFNLNAIYSHQLGSGTYSQAEFTGATSLITGFPDMNVDSMRVRQCDWVEGPTPHYFALGLPGVDYLLRRPGSETIYLFVSLTPDTSDFHNFPVAIRYDAGSYKTSYFCFPLYFMQYDQAVQVTQQMLTWFFHED